MKIIWTSFAINSFKQIYDFYFYKINSYAKSPDFEEHKKRKIILVENKIVNVYKKSSFEKYIW